MEQRRLAHLHTGSLGDEVSCLRNYNTEWEALRCYKRTSCFVVAEVEENQHPVLEGSPGHQCLQLSFQKQLGFGYMKIGEKKTWAEGQRQMHLQYGQIIAKGIAQYKRLTSTGQENTVTWLKSMPGMKCQQFPFFYLISSQILLTVFKKVNAYQEFSVEINTDSGGDMAQSQEHKLFFQRTRVKFLAPTWWLTYLSLQFQRI